MLPAATASGLIMVKVLLPAFSFDILIFGIG
jgi:hypothetical protein